MLLLYPDTTLIMLYLSIYLTNMQVFLLILMLGHIYIIYHKINFMISNINMISNIHNRTRKSGILFKDTLETPAFGGISFALRGRGALGTAFWEPIWERKKKKIWGAIGALYLERQRRPTRGGDKKIIICGAFGASFKGSLRRPEWF